MSNLRILDSTSTFFYTLLLGLVSLHFFRLPDYDLDMLGYMGNALLMQETDPGRIHENVYTEVAEHVPAGPRQHLLGLAGRADQDDSRKDRAANAYHFAEFLPCFAIRPLYNQTVYVLSKSGIGLVRGVVLISTVSYFSLGLLVYFWMRQHLSNGLYAALLAFLLMLSPAITTLGRYTGADGISTLLALLSLYLIFERDLLSVGIAILFVSIFFRTDNVVLAGPVLLICWSRRRIDLSKAVLLAMVAVASVLVINHFSGDYGIRMLYYRNFIGTPVAPGEMVAQFSFRQYLAAFRAGITVMLDSHLSLFLFFGMLAFIWQKRSPALTILPINSRTRRVQPQAQMSQQESAGSRSQVAQFSPTAGSTAPMGAASAALASAGYAALHYIVLPNWQERWFGVFYLMMAVCSVNALAKSYRPQTSASVVNECT